MTKLSGGCQCGALRYAISGPLGDASICHCRMCQKAFGSWGAALVAIPNASFTWTRGHPATFDSSSIVKRGFCASCGTPMFMQEQGDPDIELAIGTLDNPNAIGPLISQDGVESKVKWFDAMHNLPSRHTEETSVAPRLGRLKTQQHPDHDTENWPPK